jgi:sugar lactone lactonase YvrE
MRRITTALCAAGAVLALAVPASAGAAFGPVTAFGGGVLNHPQSAVSTGAQLFVSDTNNSRIVIFNSGGGVDSTLFGGGAVPQDVAVAPGGTVYGASAGQVDGWAPPLGILVFHWNPPGTSYGVAVSPTGIVWVSDTANGVIRGYDGGGAPLGITIGQGQLSQPHGLATDSAGSIYVADTGNRRIVKFGPAGNVQGIWGMPAYTINANGQIITGVAEPFDVAVDGAGRVYAPDAGTNSNLVVVFHPDGSIGQVFGSPASDPGNPCAVSGPWGLASGPSGALYVVSTGEHAIRVFDEAHGPCPEPNFGPGGGLTPGNSPGAFSTKDKKRPKVKLLRIPSKCARKDFAFRIRAVDDGIIRKLSLFINGERVARQKPNKQEWTVKVNIPVRKIQRQIPRGTAVRILVQVKVVDASGKKGRASKSFRVCR